MLRTKIQKQIRCEEHEFRLHPTKDIPNNGQFYNLSFCTCKQERSIKKISKTQRNQSNLAFPVFHKDFNYSTPAFILNSQKNYYQAQGPKMREQHQKKMQDYNEEKIELNIPKPRSKNNYCNVCKSNYQDYLEVKKYFIKHITSDYHKKKINQSPFNKDILQLSTKYIKESYRNRRINKNIVEKNISSTRIQDSDEVQIISNPQKLRKLNQYIISKDQNEVHNDHNKINYLSDQRIYHQINPFLAYGNNHYFQYYKDINGIDINRYPYCSGFKPFSSIYQEQMNQIILNSNYYFNPYTISPVSPFDIFYARQHLDILEYTMRNRLPFCNPIDNTINNFPLLSSCVVIDE